MPTFELDSNLLPLREGRRMKRTRLGINISENAAVAGGAVRFAEVLGMSDR